MLISLSNLNRLLNNTFWLGAGELAQKASVFLASILIARNFTAQEFGRISYIISFISFFVAFSDMGISPIGFRDLSRLSIKDNYWNRFVTLRFLLAPISLLGLAILLLINTSTPDILLLGFWGLVYSGSAVLADFLRICFRASEKMHYDALSKILGGAVLLGRGYLAVRTKSGLGISFSSYSAGALVALFSSILFLRVTKHAPKWKIDMSFSRGLLKQAMPILAAFLLFYFMTRVDLLAVYNLVGEESAGLYQVCVGLLMIVLMAQNVLVTAAFPLMSRSVAGGDTRKGTALLACLAFFGAGSIVYLIFCQYGRELIALIFGAKYVASYPILRWYGLLLPSFMGLQFLNSYFVVIGRQVKTIYLYGIVCALSPSILLGIREYGVNGAAMAVSLMGFVGFCLGLVFVGRLTSCAEQAQDTGQNVASSACVE